MASRSCGSAMSTSSAARSRRGSPTGTTHPVTSGSTMSANPPTPVATIGRPAALASAAAIPNASARLGRAKTSQVTNRSTRRWSLGCRSATTLIPGAGATGALVTSTSSAAPSGSARKASISSGTTFALEVGTDEEDTRHGLRAPLRWREP